MAAAADTAAADMAAADTAAADMAAADTAAADTAAADTAAADTAAADTAAADTAAADMADTDQFMVADIMVGTAADHDMVGTTAGAGISIITQVGGMLASCSQDSSGHLKLSLVTGNVLRTTKRKKATQLLHLQKTKQHMMLCMTARKTLQIQSAISQKDIAESDNC
jgi:hypothetical protein